MNKKTLDLLFVLPLVAIVSTCIASTVKGQSPADFSTSVWAMVWLSTLIGSYVAVLRTKIDGMISGILSVIVLATLLKTFDAYSMFSLCLGIVLGVVLHSHPIIVFLIGVGFFIFLIFASTIQTALLFLMTGAITFLMHEYSHNLVAWLRRPLSHLRTYKRPLIGFVFVYAGIVVLFALLYQTAYNFDPNGSFRFGNSWNDNKSFLAFLYLSIAALNSNLPSETTPVNDLAKLIVVLESLVGIFVLVVFIKFILTDYKVLEGSTKPTHSKKGEQT